MKGVFVAQGGPLPVIHGVIIPISRLITPVTHLSGHLKGFLVPFVTSRGTTLQVKRGKKRTRKRTNPPSELGNDERRKIIHQVTNSDSMEISIVYSCLGVGIFAAWQQTFNIGRFGWYEDFDLVNNKSININFSYKKKLKVECWLFDPFYHWDSSDCLKAPDWWDCVLVHFFGSKLKHVQEKHVHFTAHLVVM